MAALAAAIVLAAASATAVASPASGPPSNKTPPEIAEIPAPLEGRSVHAKSGRWRGERPLKYSYVWLRCNSSGSECVEVASTTKPLYKPTLEDVGYTLRVVVTASNGAGSVSATSAPSARVKPAPPRKDRGAVITGAAEDGQLLSASSGTWKGTPPFSYAYQWQVCNKTQRECLNIAEATSNTYRLITSEIGRVVRVVVTATNAGGSASVPSGPTPEILEGPPVSISPPAISGALEDGATLTASTGSWVGTPPFTYTYQWQRCSAALAGCEAISSATEVTYTLGPEDVGDNMEVVVTAQNKADEAGVSATSAETSPVASS